MHMYLFQQMMMKTTAKMLSEFRCGCCEVWVITFPFCGWTILQNTFYRKILAKVAVRIGMVGHYPASLMFSEFQEKQVFPTDLTVVGLLR